jgi:hypothetical protein
MCAAALRYSGGSTILHNLKGIDPTVHHSACSYKRGRFSTGKPPSPLRSPQVGSTSYSAGELHSKIFNLLLYLQDYVFSCACLATLFFFVFCSANALS